MDWMIREATEIELQHDIMNREDCLCLSQSWKAFATPSKDVVSLQHNHDLAARPTPFLFRTLSWPQPVYFLSTSFYVF
jgi:hypothetical protein